MDLARKKDEESQQRETLSGQRVPLNSKIGTLIRQMTKLTDNIDTVSKEISSHKNP
jgi:hypothetical protein